MSTYMGELGQQPATLDEAQDLLTYWSIKAKSLEAYAQRIDPYEAGLLEMVVQDLLDAQEERIRLQQFIQRQEAERYLSVLIRGAPQGTA